jgi:hypothetical protein
VLVPLTRMRPAQRRLASIIKFCFPSTHASANSACPSLRHAGAWSG